jgi:hypothetical protein
MLQRQHNYYYAQNMRHNAVQESMMQRSMSLAPQWDVMGSMLNGPTEDSTLQQSPIPAVSFMRRNSCPELMAPVHPLPNRQATPLSTIPEHEQLPDLNMMRRMSEPQHRPDVNPEFDMTGGRLLSNPMQRSQSFDLSALWMSKMDLSFPIDISFDPQLSQNLDAHLETMMLYPELEGYHL